MGDVSISATRPPVVVGFRGKPRSQKAHPVLLLKVITATKMPSTKFQYSKAVCRGIPKSLVDEAIRKDEPESPINYENAKAEHGKYIETLRQLGLEVTVLEADEALPDCVYVEDPAVICDGKALITNPGHPARKPETVAIRSTLEKLGLKISVMEAPAELDGGDVLFTGKEFFVGLSTRTNEQGITAVQNTFPLYPVHGIKVLDATLHLKSMLSMAGDNIIAIGKSKSAAEAKKQMTERATFKYEFLEVSPDAAANCLWINGTLIHRAASEFPEIEKEFANLQCPKLQLANSELCKADGALTCCSLLIG